MVSRKPRTRSKRKNHAQDGGTLIAMNVADSAPGDPAMVFMFRMASILPMVRASCPLRPAAGLLLDALAHDHFRKPQQRFYGSCKNARNERARTEQSQRRMLCFS